MQHYVWVGAWYSVFCRRDVMVYMYALISYIYVSSGHTSLSQCVARFLGVPPVARICRVSGRYEVKFVFGCARDLIWMDTLIDTRNYTRMNTLSHTKR